MLAELFLQRGWDAAPWTKISPTSRSLPKREPPVIRVLLALPDVTHRHEVDADRSRRWVPDHRGHVAGHVVDSEFCQLLGVHCGWRSRRRPLRLGLLAARKGPA